MGQRPRGHPKPPPAEYGANLYDAFVVLACAAAFTRRVRLGSTVIVVPYRNPPGDGQDAVHAGCPVPGPGYLGVGAGGAPDEFEALGVPSNQRGRRTDEYLSLMIALWTQDPTTFKGRFFSFTDVRFEPKPHQKPHPPIWVGGRSDAALRRAVRVGEAWHPTAMALPTLQERMAQLHHLSQAAGRSEGPMVTVHQGIRLTDEYSSSREDERRPGRGTPRQIREDMERYRELGVPVVVCNFAAANVEELVKAMETFTADVMPYFPESGPGPHRQ